MTKKTYTKVAGIINTIMYALMVVGSIALIFSSFALFSGTTNAIEGTHPLVAIFGALGFILAIIGIVIGIVLLIVSIIFLILSTRLIRISGFNDDRYNRKRGGIIVYLIFIIFQVLSLGGGALSLLLESGDALSVIGLIPVALLTLSTVFIIVDLSRVKRFKSEGEALPSTYGVPTDET